MSSRALSDDHTIANPDVYADILSHAVTGELVGMLNFARMADLFDDVAEKMEAVEHAGSERAHALALQAAARDLDLDLIVDVNAPYWRRIRSSFKCWADRQDLTACVVIQELMLECLAVVLYGEVALVATDRLARVFAQLAEEELEHRGHAIEFLRRQRELDPTAFDEKTEALHAEVMTVLAEMLARQDPHGHCGICSGKCVKPSLSDINLHLPTLRGKFLNVYLAALDEIGVPGERTVQWIANLPL